MNSLPSFKGEEVNSQLYFSSFFFFGNCVHSFHQLFCHIVFHFGLVLCLGSICFQHILQISNVINMINMIIMRLTIRLLSHMQSAYHHCICLTIDLVEFNKITFLRDLIAVNIITNFIWFFILLSFLLLIYFRVNSNFNEKC